MELSKFKAGFIAIVGKPNVGKSTLMNLLLGEKLSIISPKPQTTRQSIKGIYTDENKQMVFLDTPGFVKPRYELHEKMLEYIKNSLQDADLIVYITDAHKYPTDYDKEFCGILEKIKTPKLAVLNKIDLVEEELVLQKAKDMKKMNFDDVICISATQKKNTDSLLEHFASYLPFSPPFYEDGDLSDLPLKFFAQEIIREQIFLNFRDEIPYATAVVVESYKDFPNKAVINANIWLENKSQKPIVLGKNGEKIKLIRINSEKQIHSLIKKRVVLKLWIKIKQNWRKKKNALKEFGYN